MFNIIMYIILGVIGAAVLAFVIYKIVQIAKMKPEERKELINEINIFLKELPAEKRNIFILRYWGFESAAEIAKRFGKNETAVHNILQRIREKLKKHLAERGFNL